MKKLFLIVFCILLVIPSFASAEMSPSEARWDLTKKTAGFTAGFMSGLAFHELGHEIVARSEGMNIKWRGDNWRVANATNSQCREISVAGFGMQILSTEVILRSKSISKDNSYVLGWLAYNIVNQISYPLRNELSSNGHADLGNYKKHGGNVRILETALIAHAIWSFYRLKNNPDTPFFITATYKEIQIGFGWKF